MYLENDNLKAQYRDVCKKKRPSKSKIVLKFCICPRLSCTMKEVCWRESLPPPNIDHVCYVPGHARTTGNTLRTWRKFLRSLTHFASNFMKFWRTLKFPRRWGCSSFFNFPCWHGKRLHVWYFFFFLISPFPSFLLGSYFNFLLLLEVSVLNRNGDGGGGMMHVKDWVKEREIISCGGKRFWSGKYPE